MQCHTQSEYSFHLYFITSKGEVILNQKHIKYTSKMQLLQCTALHRILSQVQKKNLLIWFNFPEF